MFPLRPSFELSHRHTYSRSQCLRLRLFSFPPNLRTRKKVRRQLRPWMITSTTSPMHESAFSWSHTSVLCSTSHSFWDCEYDSHLDAFFHTQRDQYLRAKGSSLETGSSVTDPRTRVMRLLSGARESPPSGTSSHHSVFKTKCAK